MIEKERQIDSYNRKSSLGKKSNIEVIDDSDSDDSDSDDDDNRGGKKPRLFKTEAEKFFEDL